MRACRSAGCGCARARRKSGPSRGTDLAATHRRNTAIVEGAGEGVLELDNVGQVRYANPAAAKLLGYEIEELPGLDYRVLINTQSDDDNRTDPVRRVRYTTDIMRGVGALLRRKNGQFRPVEYRIVPVTEQGATVGTVLVFHDVGERVRLDNLLKDMQTTARIGGWEYDVETKKVHWTEALYAIHDLPFGQPIEIEASREMFHPEDRAKLIDASQQATDTGTSSDLHLRLTSARGRHLWVRMIIKAERRNGKIVRLHGALQDVTDRVVAERQLRETRDFFEQTLNAVPTPINYFNRDFVMTYVNRAFEEWVGMSTTKLIGKSLRELLPTDMFTTVMPYVDKVMLGERVHSRHTGMRHGIMREWQNHYVPQVDANGAVLGFFSIIYDLTEQRRLEARLLQAQKMEAIGQLTGGIAHDFNNLLGVIIGNLQLLERSCCRDADAGAQSHTAMRAAVRGADLTRRLLAFARRQILGPVVVDANRQLSGLTELMQRTLGESVEVHMVQAHDLWHTRVDAGQFEKRDRISRSTRAMRCPRAAVSRCARATSISTRFSAATTRRSSRASSYDQRQRHRRRHRARRAQARVRAVLHDQGIRTRQRPRARDGRQLRGAGRRRRDDRKHGRAGHDGHDPAAALHGRAERARGHGRHHQAFAGRQRDDPGGRGRCRSARDGRHRFVAARL